MKFKIPLLAGLALCLFADAGGENILAGKTAVFEQKPNYHLTTDENDPKDLTDGKIRNWLIWNYRSSVGWQRGKQYSFYFDLAKEMPIGNVRLHTSAGRNGVKLPKSIRIYAGNDLTELALIGEMIRADRGSGPEEKNAATTFWLEGNNCPVIARFLKFVVTPADTPEAYFFADEITVGRGGGDAVPVGKLPVSKEAAVPENSAANILAGKTAVFEQKPNYRLTTDENDPKDLTDGHINNWQVHFYKTSVGWQGKFYIGFLFDLGKVMDIGRIRIHTSQGHGGVHLPKGLIVLAGNSPDEFAILDDMIASNPDLPKYEDGPKVLWITAKNKPVKARYLKFIAIPHEDSTFFFLDEIVVSEGKDGTPVGKLAGFKGGTKEFVKYSRLRERLKRDAAIIRNNIRLSRSGRSPELPEDLLTGDASRIKQFSGTDTDFPLNEAQVKFAEFQQKILAETGYRGLVLWGGNRWDMFHSFRFPEKKTPDTVMKMTPGETRSFIINAANADPQKADVKFVVDAPFPVEVNETITAVDTGNFFNANRLQPLKPQGKEYRFDLLPGESSQLFFRIPLPRKLAAGTYPVKVKFSDGKTVTATVKANGAKFPEHLTAEHGAWDYLNNLGCHGNVIDRNNFSRAIELMRAYQIDLCWGHEIALPPARPDMFDADGKLVKPLDFSKLDEWLNLMKGFRRYAIFGGGNLNSRLNFGCLPEKEPERFTKRLVSYLNALAAHIENVHKIPVDRFRLHFVDEASTPVQKELLKAWCRGVKQSAAPSGRKFKSYGNPFFEGNVPVYPYPELDIIQPNPGFYRRDAVKRFAEADRMRDGKGFTGLYVCRNRVRQRDAYMYFGMISRLGILFDNFIGIGFWNLACGPKDVGELDYTGRIFTTWYFRGNDIMVSRQTEAILEGREDFEYMLLLKKLILLLKGSDPALSAEGEELLRSIKAEMLSELGGPHDDLSLWAVRKDRSAADRQREKIWDFAERVQKKDPAVFKKTIWK
ncbi:MAG: hypothetical protein IJS01_01345 [Lentisphaeria bacterium]|nr:hypothetical protein [Lentisphaeria bacterium]